MTNEINGISTPLLQKEESPAPTTSEAERLERLYDLPDLTLESSVAFDNLIALASLLTDTPYGAISFVDSEQKWIKTTLGLGQSQAELSRTFTAHTIREQEPCFVVPDTTQDARFANNPLVTGEPHIRFYAGVPMLSAEGLPLGSFCVMDRKSRELTPVQMELLQHIARIAMDLAERERRRRAFEKNGLFGKQISLQLPEVISRIAAPSGQIHSVVANLIAQYSPLLEGVLARIQRFHERGPGELYHVPDEPPTSLQHKLWSKLDQTALLTTDIPRQGVIQNGEAEGGNYFYAVVPLKFTNHRLARVDFLCAVPQDSRYDSFFKLMLASFSSLAEREIHTEELKYYVDHDSLTGLATRNLLLSEIDKAIKLTKPEQPTAILFHIRLDSLTELNDNFGYGSGDRALIETANRLKLVHGGDNFVARVGGDKFMVLIRDSDLEKNLDDLLSEVEVSASMPFRVNLDEIRISADVGCAVINDPTIHPIEILFRAELTLRHAISQESGSQRKVYIYAEGMFQERLKLHKTNLIVRQAYSENRFLLRFQPIFDLSKNRLIGAETLLRMKQKDGTILDAGQFISAIPRIRYQASVDDWVFSEFMRQFGRGSPGRQLLEIDDFMITINTTPIFISNKGFAEKWLSRWSHAGIPHKSIVLEVVESPLLPENEALLENIHQLRAAGVRISIDDFGSGYSNLRHLIQLPVDIVKFDRSFLSEQKGHESKSRTLLTSLITLCHELGYSPMCEGVESADQVEFLHQTGCRYVQGFFYGKAMPLSEVLALSQREPSVMVHPPQLPS